MSYYRRPRSTSEKRANIERIWNRPKRNPRNLPDAWDDIWQKSDHCWKSHRKTQYKPVNMFPDPQDKKDSSRYAEHTKRKSDPHVDCRWFHRACKQCRLDREKAWEKYRQNRDAEKAKKESDAATSWAERRMMIDRRGVVVILPKRHHNK